jgi:hypothetical protein
MTPALSNDIEFTRIGQLDPRFGLKRSTTYALINDGEIESKIVKTSGSRTGIRLINVASVRAYLARCPDKPDKKISSEMARRARARKQMSSVGPTPKHKPEMR